MPLDPVQTIAHIEATVVQAQTVKECVTPDDENCIPVEKMEPLDPVDAQKAFAKWLAIKETKEQDK